MLPNTKHGLKKLETLLRELGYTVRYEKGNFQSGYCLVESRQVAIINKFFDNEARITCLLDILSQYRPPEGEARNLSASSEKLYRKLAKFVGLTEEE